MSAAIISRAAQQYANAMAHYVSPTPASLLFDAQCARNPPSSRQSRAHTPLHSLGRRHNQWVSGFPSQAPIPSVISSAPMLTETLL